MKVLRGITIGIPREISGGILEIRDISGRISEAQSTEVLEEI